MPTAAITIEPLDLLFFRGGRPFGAGLPGVSSLPSPQALSGFLRSFLIERNGAAFSRMRGIADIHEAFAAAGCSWLSGVSFRGPFLHHPKHGLLFPAPASLAIVQRGGAKSPCAMRPIDLEMPGWSPPFPGVRPIPPIEGREKDKPQFISETGLNRFLRGDIPEPHELIDSSDLFSFQERTGIGIDPATLATQEGIIYTAKKLALRPGVSFYAEMRNLPQDQVLHFSKDVVAAWGGERHHVIVRPRKPVEWPRSANGTVRTLVYLATPCFDVNAGLPTAVPVDGLRAAATLGPVTISGWNLAKGGPRPARFGIDAGSVFFLESASVPESLSNPADTLAGYGFSLKGTWNYAN